MFIQECVSSVNSGSITLADVPFNGFLVLISFIHIVALVVVGSGETFFVANFSKLAWSTVSDCVYREPTGNGYPRGDHLEPKSKGLCLSTLIIAQVISASNGCPDCIKWGLFCAVRARVRVSFQKKLSQPLFENANVTKCPNWWFGAGSKLQH